jgi:beta-lactamase regulating signal transducer with metallopeptidase domain
VSAGHELAATWLDWCLGSAWHATWFALAGLVLERTLAHRVASAYRALPWWLFFACFALPPSLVSPFASGARELALPQALRDPAEHAVPGDLAAGLALVWLAGCAAALVRLALAHRRGLARLRAGSHPAPRAAARLLGRLAPGCAVELRASRRLGTPVLAGLLRSAIVVPEALLSRPRELEHALRHELAHHARRDPLRALVVELFAALVWFHPCARLAVRSLRQARELACDAAVARRLGAGLDGYRATLARAALRRDDGRCAAVEGFVGGARILERLAALERAPRLDARVHALAALLLFALACATLVPARASAEREFARAVLADQAAGERLSCFTVHAAALALRDELPVSSPDPTE